MKLSTFPNYSSGLSNGASEAQSVGCGWHFGSLIYDLRTLWLLKVLSKYSIAKKEEDEFNQEEDRF